VGGGEERVRRVREGGGNEEIEWQEALKGRLAQTWGEG
jgi:hypothetical protein